MTDPAPPVEGLSRRLRHLGDLALALVENRLALAATEIEVRLVLLQRMLAWGAVTALCLALGLQALALGVIVWFWDSHRIAAIAAVVAFFLAAGLGGFLALRRLLQTMPGLLEGSLEELRADRQQLSASSPSSPPSPAPVPAGKSS